jgi:hypothetical protein
VTTVVVSDTATPRDVWAALEAVHSVTYFTAEARAAHEAAGLRGFWRGYFATRAAPLGPAAASTVTAVFAGFAQDMVARAVPGVWSLVTPRAALAAREAGAVDALRRHGGDLTGVPGALPVLGRVVAALPAPGRALGAANAALPEPAEPVAALWWAATAVRESRGDGHVAVVTAEGLDGLLPHVLRAAGEGAASVRDGLRDRLLDVRGFTPAAWARGADELRTRGLLDTGGALTAEGSALRLHVEARTDALAATAWAASTVEERQRVLGVLRPLARRLAAGAVPYPNPVGAPAP